MEADLFGPHRDLRLCFPSAGAHLSQKRGQTGMDCAIHLVRRRHRHLRRLDHAHDHLQIRGASFFLPSLEYAVVVSLGCHVQGKVRVARLGEEWTRSDALAAPSYGAAPVWRASAPGLLRDAIVRIAIKLSDLLFYYNKKHTGVDGQCALDQEKPI